MTEYEKLLLRPEWDKRRRSILRAWGGGCMRCETEDRPLHVHHKYYLPGKLPWEYPTDAFEVLCDICHRKEHNHFVNVGSGIRPVKTIRQVMVEFIELMQKKLNGK